MVSTGLAMQMLFALAVVMLGLTLLASLPHSLAEALPMLGWAGLMAGLLLAGFLQWNQYILDVVRLHFAPWRFLVLSLVSRVASAAAMVAVVVGLGWGVDGLLVTQAVVTLLALPVGLMLIRKDLTRVFDRGLASMLFGYGHPFIFVGLAFWLLSSMDRWMLAAMSSVEEVGVYSVALRFASVILFVSTAFGQAWSPMAIRLRTTYPTTYRVLYGNILLALLCLMVVAGGAVALFAGEVIGLVMPPGYGGAAAPLAVLSIGMVLQSTNQVTAVGISIEQKTHLFARLMWLVAGVNFLFNLILIPRFGAIGAAWATTLAYLVLSVAYAWLTQRIHPLVIPWRPVRLMLGIGACLAILSISLVNMSIVPQEVGLKALALVLALALACKLIPWRSLNHA